MVFREVLIIIKIKSRIYKVMINHRSSKSLRSFTSSLIMSMSISITLKFNEASASLLSQNQFQFLLLYCGVISIGGPLASGGYTVP